VGYFKRGNIYRLLENYHEAEKDYLMAVQLFPQSFSFLFNLAQFYIEMGQPHKAKAYAEQGIC